MTLLITCLIVVLAAAALWILRLRRANRELRLRLEVLHRILDDENRQELHDRRRDLHDAVAVIARMHDRFLQQKQELESLDDALRILAEGQLKMRLSEVG